MKKVSLYIVDEYPVVRQGIKALFAKYSQYNVVGEGDNSDHTFEEAARLNPDVVITEFAVNKSIEPQTAANLMEKLRNTKVIIFSMESSRENVVGMLQAGVNAYVMKNSPSEELVSAVQSVMDGKRHISRSLTEKLFNDYILKNKDMEPFDTLSDREKEVLGLIAEGGRARELAEKLSISVSTIKKHKSNIMKKLHARGMADLVRIALSKGVVRGLHV